MDQMWGVKEGFGTEQLLRTQVAIMELKRFKELFWGWQGEKRQEAHFGVY